METIELATWDDYETQLSSLRARFRAPASSQLLFRGQGESAWPLTTTLERQSGCGDMLFEDYYRLMCRIAPAIGAFTSTEWHLPSLGELQKLLQDPSLGFDLFPPLSLYRYMVYLRHYGFPSPLLDWTSSPYVAAFFAFRDGFPRQHKRSIFVLCERPEGRKMFSIGPPRIRSIGPYVQTAPRHFRQQSDYSICASREGDAWRFASHEAVFNDGERNQDLLWKLTLPSGERTKILQHLSDYNLNAFSLFDSEESLLETMWFREYVFTQG